MNPSFFLKILLIHLFAKSLAFASVSSWAFQQIETEKAQALTRSSSLSKVTVAVIDTGIDVNHPALREALWTNPGETGPDQKGRNKATNGIDDDGNGFVDDVHGWNFVTRSNDLSDFQGHGTHIAGLIAAHSPEFSGVAPGAKLMVLKYYDPRLSSYENLQNEIRAFRYAIQMKAQIINFSGGGPGSNAEEEGVLREAEKKNILVVAAAGNDGVDTDRFRYYPANYEVKNILSVTATDNLRRMTKFANYGLTTAHLAAPGENIRSTAVGGGYIELSGTSQSTALASGVAALLLAQAPMSVSELIDKIKAGSLFEDSLVGRSVQPGILNTYRSLAMKGAKDPAVDLDLDLEGGEDSSELKSRYVVRFEALDPSAELPHLGRQESTSIPSRSSHSIP
jgi:subtilisin family serine protease